MCLSTAPTPQEQPSQYDTIASLPQSDILPDEFIIDQASMERKLSRINMFKSVPAPDKLSNWILRAPSSIQSDYRFR